MSPTSLVPSVISDPDASPLTCCLLRCWLQKIDKELAQALETLEKERKSALSDLDEQVPLCWFSLRESFLGLGLCRILSLLW